MDQDRQSRTAWLPATIVCVLVLLLAIALLLRLRDIPSRSELVELNGKVTGIAGRLDAMDAKLDKVSTRIDEIRDRHRELSRQTMALREAARGPARRKPAPIAPGVKFHDTFEENTNGWFVMRFAPQITGQVTRTDAEGQVKEGKGALALSYTIAPEKLPIAVRMARNINSLSLWVRAFRRPVELYVGASEKDDSSYGKLTHLDPKQGWQQLTFDFDTFTLGDDSEDENDVLDIDQIRSISVCDLAAFMGGSGANVLLIDEVVGEYRKPQPAEGGKKEEF